MDKKQALAMSMTFGTIVLLWNLFNLAQAAMDGQWVVVAIVGPVYVLCIALAWQMRRLLTYLDRQIEEEAVKEAEPRSWKSRDEFWACMIKRHMPATWVLATTRFAGRERHEVRILIPFTCDCGCGRDRDHVEKQP